MTNYTGIILAITVFVSVGIGHEFVRKVNYLSGTKYAKLVYAVGIGMFVYSIFVESLLLSAVIGIVAITVLWDGYELGKQEERIRNGVAPENPKRPVKNKIKEY